MFITIALALTIAQPDAPGDRLLLSLDDAVELGTEKSFRLQRAVRNDKIAEQRLRGTKAGLGPRLDVGYGADQSQRYYDFRGTYDYNQGQPGFQTDATANASYNIDIAGVTKRQVRHARLGRDLSQLDRRQATLDVATDIRTSYVQALRAQEQVEAATEYLALIDALLERAKVSQPNVAPFLQTERQNAQQSLQSTKTDADLAYSNLRQQLRLDNDQAVELTSELRNPAPLPSNDRLLQIAYQNRTDLKQSDIRLQQARLAKVQATDSRKPSLRASAYAGQAFNGDYLTLGGKNHGRTRQAAALLNLNVPLFLFDGGQLNSNKQIAMIQADQAVADSEEAKERAANEINRISIGLARAQERLESLPDATQARQSLAQAEQQMLSAAPGEAAGALAQVTNARQNWRSSVVSRNDALTDFYASFFRLQRSLGTEQVSPELNTAVLISERVAAAR
jgi:outer membrane protein TolC